METFSRYLNLEQISFNNILGCASEVICSEKGTIHLPLLGPREVICPEPCRATRIPYIADCLNRNLPSHIIGPSVDISKLTLVKDDLEDELDISCSQMGIFSCSPPVRTNNPVVHDVQFILQTSMLDSPSGNAHQVKYSNETVGVTSHGTTKENPMVRIEGFAFGGSESHCISARA